MAERKFRAGHRTNTPRLRGTGRMSENRFAWLRTAIGQFTIMKYLHAEYSESIPEEGPTVLLYIPRPGGRDISFNITSLTTEEVRAMREFFTLLFDEAEPVVVERDRIAHEALSNGDDSFIRVYRQLPQYIIRKRQGGEDDQRIRRGSSDVPAGSGGVGDLDGGLRGHSDELADGEPPEAGTEDDGSETDQPEGVRQVGG